MDSKTQQCVIEREMYLYETESEHDETDEETVDDISRKSKHKCNKKIKVKTRVNFDQLPTTKEDELNITKSAFNNICQL